MNNKIKTISATLVVLLLTFSSISSNCISQNIKEVNSQFLEFTYEFEYPITESNRQGKILKIRDLDLHGDPGNPILPFKTIKILIPYGHNVENVEIKQNIGILLPERFNIAQGQQPIPYNNEKIIPTEKNDFVYNSNELYPGFFSKTITTQYLNGFKILIINLYPIQYLPTKKEVYFHPILDVKVKIQPTEDINKNTLGSRNNQNDKIRVKQIVENPEFIDTYITENSQTVLEGEDGLANPLETYEYVVITNEELRDSTTENYNFWDLVDSKINKGLTATIVTVEDIESCSAYWDDNAIFNDTAAHIRNFIRDAYENWDTQYVLLGGDGDTQDMGGESGDNIIPVRYFQSILTYDFPDYMPSDLYYSALDGDWNVPEIPYPSNKDISIGDQGVTFSGGKFLSEPVIDYTDSIKGESSALYVCDNTASDRGRCNILFDPPIDISDKKWLNFYIKLSTWDFNLRNITLYDSDGNSASYMSQDVMNMWELPSNTWKAEHFYLPNLYNYENFNSNSVEYFSIELINDIRNIEDTVKIDNIHFTDFRDDLWGEVGEDDLLSEVFIGRAPVDNPNEVSNFVRKTLVYESSDDEEYLQDVLMVGEHLGFGDEADWGGNYKDEIRYGCDKYGYTTVGIPPYYNVEELYDRNWEENGWTKPDKGIGGWEKSDISDIINDDVHLINHLGHGNNFHVMKLDEPVFMKDNEIYGPFHDIVNRLTNDKPFFLYSQACLPGAFDNVLPPLPGRHPWCTFAERYFKNDSIIEFLIGCEHGAFACVLNTRYGIGYGDTNGPSQNFDREFFNCLFSDEGSRGIGEAMEHSRVENIGKLSSFGIRYCYYETTLFGDPEISIKDPPLPEHDLSLYNLDFPKYAKINSENLLNATIFNVGENEESNIVIDLLVDGIVIDSKQISNLPSKNQCVVSFIWTPKITGIFDIEISIQPVLGENNLDDNEKNQNVTVSSSYPIKVCVLDSFGADLNYLFYNHINDDWYQMGTVPVIVDRMSLNFEDFTYEDLKNSNADVLLIDMAWYIPDLSGIPFCAYQYTEEEIEAIQRYVEDDGHGLIITADSFNGRNSGLLSLVGIDSDLGGDEKLRLGSGGHGGWLNVQFADHPIYRNIPNPYYTVGSSFVPIDDKSWDVNDLTTGKYGSTSYDKNCAVVINKNCVYISQMMNEKNANENDTRLFYNTILYTIDPSSSALYVSANGPYCGLTENKINFIGSAFGGEPPYNWTWDFGDESPASYEKNPSHSYAEPGLYIATLTVKDNNSNTSVDTCKVSIFSETVWIDDDADPSWYDNIHVSTIQDGIDIVGEGGSVYVLSGTYFENLIIEKQINLIGEDKNNTVIDGRLNEKDVIYVSENHVNISGFTLINSIECGIFAIDSYDLLISDNIIKDNARGIRLKGSFDCNIYYNALINNTLDNGKDDNNNNWDDGINQGNYWDDYIERYPKATNNKNIWDTPYDILGGSSQDKYPLVNYPSQSFFYTYIYCPYEGSVNLDIKFYSLILGGTPAYSYLWDFGDGETSSDQNPTHSYDSVGDYTITLIVTDDKDIVATDTALIKIKTNISWVDSNAPHEWYDETHVRTIQKGIDVIGSYGIVHVKSGRYFENVLINKSLDLIGEDKYTTIIDGSNFGSVITIESSWVKVTGFTIQNCGSGEYSSDSGVYLYDVERTNISNNIITDNNKYGINLVNVDRCKIIGNNISSSSIVGIYIRGESYNNIICENTITGPTSYGIDLQDTTVNIIFNNYFIGCGYGIYILGDSNFNMIYYNAFINNDNHARNAYENIWDDCVNKGNYWDDYEVKYPNANNDGQIWDTPYKIGSCEDRYPLVNCPLEDMLIANAYGPYSDFTGEEIQFNGSAIGGEKPYNWYWDFGDGKNSSIQNPTHSYSEAGTYNVTLTVTDNKSKNDSAKTLAIISDLPPSPKLDVGLSSSFRGLTGYVQNIGNLDAINVTTEITIKGGFIRKINVTSFEQIPILSNNTLRILSSKKVRGFGRIEVTITADADNAEMVTKKSSGFIFLTFIFGLK